MPSSRGSSHPGLELGSPVLQTESLLSEPLYVTENLKKKKMNEKETGLK